MRTVFVTGATGAIGSDLVQRLLAEEGTRLRLLLRATSREHLDTRLLELFRFWNLNPKDPGIAARVEAFAGDVTQRRLGLDESIWDRLAAEVTHVIHSAGNVKLNRPLEEARQSALESARQVVSFVETCGNRVDFRKLEFVSTVGVGGLMAGDLPERAIVEPRAFRNSYEAAKAEAEAFVLERIQNGLPATIHRPSMVVGDSATGRIIQFQVFYHLCEFLSGARTHGVIPALGGFRLDIIPVDYVARAIQIASTRDDTVGRILHECSGVDAPTLQHLAHRVRETFRECGRPTPPLRAIPLKLLRWLLPAAEWLANDAIRRDLRTLPYFLAYLDTPQTFRNEASRAFYSSAGLDLPATDRYLDVVLRYYCTADARRESVKAYKRTPRS